jgi:hypothetical protein
VERTLILLVTPEQTNEDVVGATESEEEYKVRWSEFLRLRKVLKQLGFSLPSESQRDKSFVAFLEGCNWEAKAVVQPFYLSDNNLRILEGRAQDLEQLRQQALAKLSTEEKVALGLLYKDYDLPHRPYRMDETLYDE